MRCPVCGSENPARADVCFTCRALLAPITRGTVIASRYVVLRWLGQGAMGTVYEARDRILDEPVALKVIRVDPDEPSDLARRFRSEIKLARKVTHPYVCRIYEYGEEQSCRYISMELIEGMDLKRLVREGGPLPPAEACRVAIQIADGLHAVHRVGIVHRDLKPQNVMLDLQGEAKLMDFGLAKSWRAEGTDGRPGYVVGTPEYMSPEQARGEAVDLRSDIYALGIVCYEIFTGAVPFRGSTPATTLLLQIQQPPPLDDGEAEDRGLPPSLVAALRRSLAKHAEDRYPSALEMADALREVRATLTGHPQPARAVDGMRAPPRAEVSTRSLRAVRRAPPGWRRPPAIALAAALAASAAFWALERRGPLAPPPAVSTPMAALSPRVPAREAPRPSTSARATARAPRPEPATLAEPPPPSPSPGPSAPAASEPPPTLLAQQPPVAPLPSPVVEAPGRLQVGVRPWAEVVLDGRSLGTTPLKPIQLAPGEHTARLRHPDFPPVTRTVRIRAGETTELRVDLRVDGMETEKN